MVVGVFFFFFLLEGERRNVRAIALFTLDLSISIYDSDYFIVSPCAGKGTRIHVRIWEEILMFKRGRGAG